MDAIKQRLKELNFDPEVILHYNEPHRFYHTIDHIRDLVKKLDDKGLKQPELFLAAVFHDIVYDPRSSTNEEDSAEFFIKASGSSSLSAEQKEHIKQLILDTKTHKPSVRFSEEFISIDLSVLNGTFGELVRYEQQIFREFQFVDYKIYKQKRVELLEHYNKDGKLNALIDYVRTVQPHIAVFAGSFNPFHKGHFNVLQKAERLFDKVIIAFGKNPDKNGRTWPIPKVISFHQQEEYTGLLTDFIDSLGYEVTVVRGLRNSTDFQYEQNQYRYIQELKPDIRIVNVFCDKEFEHISSSGIRTLEKYNKHKPYLLE
jgi:pantetheine-phosphate adenylyltransferase